MLSNWACKKISCLVTGNEFNSIQADDIKEESKLASFVDDKSIITKILIVELIFVRNEKKLW